MDSKTSKLITGRAVGYWGRSPHTRIKCEDVSSKVIRWHIDKIMSMGLPFAIWREASFALNNLPVCSCVKDTAKQPDVPCLSCYGTGKIPGYVKFGTRNYWVSSVDSGWTLTNVELDKSNRPFRLCLNSSSTTGNAISPLVSIDTTGKLGNWDQTFNGFTRDGGAASSITVEIAKNGTLNWQPIASINTVSPTSSIRFKVTFARSSTAIKSPMLEMIRVRFPTMLDIRGELNEPIIRVLSTWDRNVEYRTSYGIRTDNSGKRFWTIPLSFFDATIQHNTKLARLEDDVIAEVRYGNNIGCRFAFTEFDYSDTFGDFSRHEFGMRQYSGTPGSSNDGEYAYKVW